MVDDWSGWQPLGGGLTSDPTVAVNDDGTLEVFVKGTDNALHHIWQTSPGGSWSGWQPLGGGLTSNIAVAKNAHHGLEAFVKGTDNALYHNLQSQQHGTWSGWQPLGGSIRSNPAVASFTFQSSGINQFRLEAFAKGTDGALYHIWHTLPVQSPTPPPQPQTVALTLQQTTQVIGATHVGALSGPGGIIKSVKNLEQFAWWLSHTDNQSPPTWYDARLEAGEIKTLPYNAGGWAGMYTGGEYRGNYGGSGPVPGSLHAEIELQS